MPVHGRNHRRPFHLRLRRRLFESLEPRTLLSGVPPTISDIGDQSTVEDVSTAPISFTVDDLETPAAELAVTVTSDNPALLPDTHLELDGSGADRTLTLRPADNQFGTATVTVTVSDGTNATEETFTITVNAVNDPPSFTRGEDEAVDEDSGQHSTGGWAIFIGPGAANEWAQALEFLILVENDDLFALLPTIDSLTGELTYEPATNAYGTAVITVQLKDDGGVAYGGNNVSAEETFTITFRPVNDPPTVANPAEGWTTPQRAPFHETLPADTFEDIDGDPLTYSATLADGSPLPSWLGFDPATQTFSGTPANDDVGTVTVKVTAVDPHGESAEDEFEITVANVNDAPVADPGGPYYVSFGQDLTLDASASYDPDAPFGDSIAFYRWDIGERGIWAYSGEHDTVPWADLVRFGSDTPVSVRLEVTDSFGVSASTVTEVIVASATELPPTDFVEISVPDLLSSDAWYKIPAIRDGWLTVQALREDVELVLYDASLGVRQTASAIGGIQRLDEVVQAGETSYIRLHADSGTVDLRIANLVRHEGASVSVYGTSASDAFEFDASAGRKLVIKGIDYQFDPAEASTFTFDGLGGGDPVRFLGGGGPDDAVLRPTSGTLNGEGYTLDVSNVGSIDYDGGDGQDNVTVWGSKGTNSYQAGPGSGEMTGDGVSILVRSESIFARGNGGGDTVFFRDSPGDDLLEYFPVWARMSGEGYFNLVKGFKLMFADAELGQNGADKVIFRGSAANDFLRITPVSARFLSGTGSVWHVARGFDTIVAYGRGGRIIDKLILHDTPDADAFTLRPLEASLVAPTYTVTTHGFGTVEVYRLNQNQSADQVALADSNGDDTLVGNPQKVTLSGSHPAYSITVFNFPSVLAYSSGAGYDVAHFSDFVEPNDPRVENDVFTAKPLVAQLVGPGYKLWARLFDEVLAEAKFGHDVANLKGSVRVDRLVGTATDVTLSGTNVLTAFANHARFFDEINADAVAAEDEAILTDALVDQATYGPPEGVSLENLAQILWLNKFEAVELAKTGTGETTDINGVDRIFACWE